MKLYTKVALIIVLTLIVTVVVRSYHAQQQQSAKVTVSYACNEGKTVEATMYPGVLVPPKNEGDKPTLTGHAKVVLSDGRTMDLGQTISADGVRYANDADNFVFWTKGNGALVLENNQEKSYIGCVAVRNDPGGLPNIYHGGSGVFSLRYPDGFTPTPYVYQNLGPGKEIGGTKFTIPESFATGTNLSSDSYISIEEMPDPSNCSAQYFLLSHGDVSTTTDQGMEYSYASTTDAAAGNRYVEEVYSLPSMDACFAVRYFIHYGAYENYPEGSIKRFDESTLLKVFDTIRRSLVINY